MTIWSLRARLMLLVLLAVFPMVVLEFDTAAHQEKKGARDAEAEVVRMVKLCAGNEQAIVESARQLLMTLAQVDAIRRHDTAACHPLLARLLKQNPTYVNIGAADAAGNVYCSAIPMHGPVSVAGRAFMQRTIETRDFSVGDYDIGRITGIAALNVGYPILNDNGQVEGLVYAALNLDALSQFGKETSILPGSVLMMVGADGHYLVHYPYPETYIGKPSTEGIAEAARETSSSEGVIERTGADGVLRLYAFAKLKVAPPGLLVLSVGIPKQSAYAMAHQRLIRQLWVITGIAVIALIAAWFIGSVFIVKPAKHLVGVARAVSSGDLDVRSSLAERAGEFGEIGSAMNQMADTLSRRISQLDHVQQELRKAHDLLETKVEKRTVELLRARERLVNAIENIDAGFAMFGPDEKLVICNETFRQMFNSCAAQIKQGVSYEEMLRSFIRMGAKIGESKSPEEWAMERLQAFRAADGRNFDQKLNGRWLRVRDHRTHDGGVVSLRTDVTALKDIQENLSLRDRALAAVSNGVLVTDPNQPDNPIVDVNPAFERITGYTKAEVLGLNCRVLQGPETDPAARAAMREAIAAEEDCAVTIKNYRKDGSSFWNSLKISPVRDSAGKLTHFVGIISDETARVEGQKNLQRTSEELRRSNEELEQFAYVASHDLQEPLRMVASYTQLLARRYKDKLDDSGREFIEFAVDGAKRMQEFIQDLLQYSRVGTHGRPFQTVNTNIVVQQVLANLRFAIGENHADVVVGDLPTIWADPVQLTQVFQNLLGNAVKFHGEAPLRIEVSATKTDLGWEFQVRDNGIGIEEKDAERIFVIFQRLHTRQEYEGTGIGLAICKKIVERHGGRIWVDSKKGEGSSFHFTICNKQEESASGTSE